MIEYVPLVISTVALVFSAVVFIHVWNERNWR